MTRYTRRRLAASVKVGLGAIPFVMAVRAIHGEHLLPWGPVLGFLVGFLVGAAEFFVLRERLRGLPFWPALGLKALALVVVMQVTLLALHPLNELFPGLGSAHYDQDLFMAGTLVSILEGLAITGVLFFILEVDRLMGPGRLVRLVTGKYHRPRREDRVFMFVDIRGSTSLAEALDPESYLGLVQDYFAAMTEPILEAGAEIYQYVGDEIVLTWRTPDAVRDATCVRTFFSLKEAVAAEGPRFLERYGRVPEFKAGMHGGEVLTAQVGEIKREIVYNGDVLNTTARIEGSCNRLGQELLVSATLLDHLDLAGEFQARPMGEIDLRGKEESMPLFGIVRA
jgi:adenylate cyclase